MANPIRIQKIPMTHLKTKVYWRVSWIINFKNPNHIKKYDEKIAKQKRSPAKIVFFLLLDLDKMVVRRRSITAKAQGLILSESAPERRSGMNFAGCSANFSPQVSVRFIHVVSVELFSFQMLTQEEIDIS